MKSQSALWNPFCTYVWMVVYTNTCVQWEPTADILTEINVSGKLIHLLVYSRSMFTRSQYFVPWFTSEVLIIKSYGQTITGKESGTLIPWYTQHFVFRVEMWFLRFFSYLIAIIDFMPSPVIEKAQTSWSLFIMIFQSKRCHSTSDTRIVVNQWYLDSPRIGSIKMGYIHISPYFPERTDIIT